MPHHTSLIAMLVFGFVLAFVLGALANRLRLSPLRACPRKRFSPMPAVDAAKSALQP